MLSWQDLIAKSDDALDKLDIVEKNATVAVGLPGLLPDAYSCLGTTIDAWAKRSLREIKNHYPLFDRDPAAFQHSKNRFRVMGIITVLQRDLRIRYDSDLIHRNDFFADPRNVFLHGVVNTYRGTCSNLPVLLVAVSRRLGFPLKLVSAKSHLFARWDSPEEKFNIEATSLGFVSHPDEYYTKWPFPSTPQEVRNFSFLKSMSPKEELAFFLACRGHVFLDNFYFKEASEAYGWAYELHPQCQLHLSSLEASNGRWRRSLLEKWNRPFPVVNFCLGSRIWSSVPPQIEAHWRYLDQLQSWVAQSLQKETYHA